MRKIYLAAAFCMLVLPVLAQSNAEVSRTIDNAFVLKQFGDQFTLLPNVPPVFGDLDGDGVEDVVIAARCKNPLLDQAEHNYHVVDPYYEFFGYGDPRITTTFSAGDPRDRGLVALIIHGSGPEAWRSPKPKAKFVIVNLPYKSLSVRRIQINKKHVIEGVYVEETGELGEASAVFYDAKRLRYRYVPMGGSMQ
ncbi:MAG TPA: hypothetical protein VL983_10725 [Terriglobales bacterium]|nr:hypothetical protein [Terriglobales bacterium]